MIWLAWRQHRGAVVAAAAGLVVLGVLLLVSGRSMASAFHDDGLASCIEGLQRVGPAWRGKPVLAAQQIEDVVAFLRTLRN